MTHVRARTTNTLTKEAPNVEAGRVLVENSGLLDVHRVSGRGRQRHKMKILGTSQRLRKSERKKV